MKCHRCGAPLEIDPRSMRAVCGACTAWVHCCRNCDFYQPGANNDCREPSAERVADKEAGNFCDWFRPGSAGGRPSDAADDARARLARLFGKKPEGGS